MGEELRGDPGRPAASFQHVRVRLNGGPGVGEDAVVAAVQDAKQVIGDRGLVRCLDVVPSGEGAPGGHVVPAGDGGNVAAYLEPDLTRILDRGDDDHLGALAGA